LYAENPAKKFLPSTGRLETFFLPDTFVRVDSALEQGGEVSPFYDPMIAKLIAHAASRESAADTLALACRTAMVDPVKTNAGFLARCLQHPRFTAGEVDTGLIENHLAELTDRRLGPSAIRAIADRLGFETRSPLSGFRMNAAPAPPTFDLEIDGETVSVELVESGPTDTIALIDMGDSWRVFDAGEIFQVRRPSRGRTSEAASSDGAIRSPMPGRIVAVQVKAGDKVAANAPVLTLEAMKMEHVMTAPFAGLVEEVAAVAGAQVEEGVVLVRVRPE
jgi:acetyl/propionyl-CoA carboxylase alpha subunit